MTFRIHSFIASSLFIAILATSIFAYYPAPRANAQAGAADVVAMCAGSLGLDLVSSKVGGLTDAIGTSVPTSDGGQHIATAKGTLENCLLALKDLAIKVLLAQLKKRLLDRLTDDTVKWISGDGGKPQFITNFGSVFKQSADEALGETLRASGMGKLCSDRLSLQVQLSLRNPPTFSQAPTCTLTGAAKNIAAFGDNFKNGSWIGYGQLLEPSNNRWGLELLAKDALANKKTELTESAKLKTTSNQGYSPTVWCKAWTLAGIKQGDTSSVYADVATINYTAFPDKKERAPNDPPAVKQQVTDTILSNDPYQYSQLTFRCKPEDREGSTPGGVLAAVTTQAFTSDWNTIAAMDDLTPYLSAIFDAAVNRLKKEGVKGLQNATKDIFSDNAATNYTAPASTGVDPVVTDLRTAYAAALLQASSTQTLLDSALAQNGTALTQLSTLDSCQRSALLIGSGVGASLAVDCPKTGAKLATIMDYAAQLRTQSSALNATKSGLSQIQTQVNSNKLSVAALGSLNAILADVEAKLAVITSAVQKIVDATTADATLISNALTVCANAVKTNSAYSCPVWP